MESGSILISLSIALIAGLLLSRLAKLIKLPAVTAYLVAGVLIGPFMLGSFGIKGLGIVSEELGLLKIISEGRSYCKDLRAFCKEILPQRAHPRQR